MRSKSEVWLLSLGLAYAVLMPCAISAVIAWKDMPALIQALGGQTAAAWVQGIGTVIAIFASAGIAMKIDRNAARRLRDERRAIQVEHYVSARDAILTAIAKAVEAQKLFEKADGDTAALDLGPIAKTVSVALTLVDHYLARQQTPADLTFALIYTRNELISLQSAAVGDANSVLYFNLQYALSVAIREIRETLTQLDAGVFAAETAALRDRHD